MCCEHSILFPTLICAFLQLDTSRQSFPVYFLPAHAACMITEALTLKKCQSSIVLHEYATIHSTLTATIQKVISCCVLGSLPKQDPNIDPKVCYSPYHKYIPKKVSPISGTPPPFLKLRIPKVRLPSKRTAGWQRFREQMRSLKILGAPEGQYREQGPECIGVSVGHSLMEAPDAHIITMHLTLLGSSSTLVISYGASITRSWFRVMLFILHNCPGRCRCSRNIDKVQACQKLLPWPCTYGNPKYSLLFSFQCKPAAINRHRYSQELGLQLDP